MSTHPINKPTCYHCGQECPPATDRYRQLLVDEKIFCCEGCKAVYELLSENQLCQYYDLEKSPGKSPRLAQFDFLDHAEIQAQLIEFTDGRIANVTLYCPSIHCSSCLYLLEHLYRIHPAIEGSRVDFLKKHVHIRFRPAEVSLRQLAELLTSVGYEPLISLNDVVQEKQQPTYKPLLYRLAVAGFCAGNSMLLSFPEYLGLDDPSFRYLFGYLNVFLATPVVFYSGWGYFESVWAALRAKRINIDLPILVGILTAYSRGIYEVITQTGVGYFDSVTGLIFFLLIGKWFQQKTYAFLSFERDYKSYFPLAATRLRNGTEEPVPIQSLRKGDHIRIRNQELIPADGILYKGLATIDYSFVTGEAEPEAKAPGTLLYAGGKQVGEAIEMEVAREVSQSYLTQLWNNDAFRKETGEGSWAKPTGRFADAVGKYFTIAVLTLATAVGLYWACADPTKAINSFTAILIIACPCVLSLSYPFALGHGMRLLGRLTFYLKNTDVIERIAGCDTIVFDKTGTLTSVKAARITADFDYPLDGTETAMIASLVRNSAHPLSRQLAAHLAHAPALPVQHFTEITGRGILGLVAGQIVRLGARSFVNPMAGPVPEEEGAAIHVSIDHHYCGCFRMGNRFREGIQSMLADLSKRYTLHLLSGDHEGARAGVEAWFPKGGQLVLACSPQGKLDFVRTLQEAGHRVIMVGDGLNDAGALKQADVGIAVTDDTVQFTPSSDAILEASALRQLPRFLQYSRFGMRLIRFSFLVSLIYNGIGLSFAIAGNLSPVVAAILMPMSSATMVLIATLGMHGQLRHLSLINPCLDEAHSVPVARTPILDL